MKIIKEKEKLVRDTVQKKMCVVMFGVQEKNQPLRTVREKDEMKRAKEIIAKVAEDDAEIVDQVEEVHRLGRYETGKTRPLKVRFSVQSAAEHVLQRTGKLARVEEMKQVWIKRDMNEEERKKERELLAEAQTKNEERTEEQVENFYWRVVDQKVRKWWKNTMASR